MIKTDVKDFWEAAACGEDLLLPSEDRKGFQIQSDQRYRLEPFIIDFAEFDIWKGKCVLEIGVGLGADHQKFVESGANIVGIDLTNRAIELTRSRLKAFDLNSTLEIGDAESLAFSEETFDCVYSWGVIHHSPDTQRAVKEIYRVLRPGGIAKVMIYNKWSMVGIMLWLRYALMRLKPWVTLTTVYAEYLESPGTKAFTTKEARRLFGDFDVVNVATVLSHGDLLASAAGQRHRGKVLDLARLVWPRWFIKRYMKNWGLFMMINAQKGPKKTTGIAKTA